VTLSSTSDGMLTQTQIDALLPNVRPKPSRIPPLDRFLLSLHSFLLALPPVAPQHPLEAARCLLKEGISVPYALPLPSEDTNWKVAFEKPRDITLVGSWGNKASVKGKDGSKFGVDLAVEMPEVRNLTVTLVVLLPYSILSESLSRERLSQWSIFPQTSLLSRYYRRCDPELQN